ncbi:MAG: putative sulfate exporter family transporter [Halalkalicoccus sp.]
MSIKAVVPGIALLIGIGLAGRAMASVVPGLNHLILAIVVGLVVGNTIGTPEWAESGTGTHKLWLEAGIVLMGASIAVDQVIEAGPQLVGLIVGMIAFTILTVEALARGLLDIPEKTGSLLAAGSSICGVSAVVAVAGTIKARQEQIAYAAATVLLFDAVTIFAYPILGRALGLSDIAFGIWAGVTMFSTGPAAAAGFAVSDTAGQWAVLTKLTRNALIGGAVVAYALYYTRREQAGGAQGTISLGQLWGTFPKFVIGFFAVMMLASLGGITEAQTASIENASDWLFLIAFAGLGLDIRFAELRSTGVTPILAVLLGLVTASVVSLSVIAWLF